MKKEVATKKKWSRLKETKSKEEIHVATPKGVNEVATCYTGRDMKTGIEVLTRKMMSQPLIQVAT